MFAAQLPQQMKFSLKVDIMRQFKMLDKAGRLNVIRMRQDEFFVASRGRPVLRQFIGPQGTINKSHSHGFSLGLAEGEAVAARKLRWRRFRSLELIDHVTFGKVDASQGHRETDVLGKEFDLDFTETQFAYKG